MDQGPVARCTDIKNMKRLNIAEMFAAPESYQPPEDISQFSTNTQYPNLNSREYLHKPYDETLRIQKFYEIVVSNELGNVVLACNDYVGRVWNGSLWGFEDITTFGDEGKASYKLRCQSPVTNMQFVESNMVR